jgi:hypothetical protein
MEKIDVVIAKTGGAGMAAVLTLAEAERRMKKNRYFVSPKALFHSPVNHSPHIINHTYHRLFHFPTAAEFSIL